MRLFSNLAVALLATILWARPAAAASTAFVDDFSKLTNWVFVDVTSASKLSPVTVNGVTITSAYDSDGGFAGYGAGPASDPGDGNGYLYVSPSANHPSYLQIIFSQPVAAVGVTFMHFPSNREPTPGLNSPATLEAFTGPDLSGSLRVVTSSGMGAFGLSTPDFVGVWSGSANIQSIKLAGTNASQPSFAVDGYAFSMTPLPEPSLAGATLVFLVSGYCLRRVGRNEIHERAQAKS
jgi:hypothetical protein